MVLTKELFVILLIGLISCLAHVQAGPDDEVIGELDGPTGEAADEVPEDHDTLSGVRAAKMDAAPVDAPGGIHDVIKYGAVPDGKKESSMAFIKAWKAACNAKTPATVLIPKGIFLTGPVLFEGLCPNPTPITVQVDGTIKALEDVSEYSEGYWFMFENVNGLHVRGLGVFDGQGKSAWQYNDCGKSPDCTMLPTNVKFAKVKNAVVEEISVIDSKGFQMVVNHADNITMQNLKITAPGNSPNTDGIHISGSNDIKVLRSVIGTGDDCISIGQGATNILVNQITCGPGHGISVGSLGKRPDEQDVSGITISNCTLTGTTNGARIKTWGGSKPTLATSIHYEDIVMNDVANPIFIDQNYCPDSDCHKSKPSFVQLSDISFRNIRGTSATDVPVRLICSPKAPCQKVAIADINLTYNGRLKSKSKKSRPQGPVTGSECSDVKIAYSGVQVPPPCP